MKKCVSWTEINRPLKITRQESGNQSEINRGKVWGQSVKKDPEVFLFVLRILEDK